MSVSICGVQAMNMTRRVVCGMHAVGDGRQEIVLAIFWFSRFAFLKKH